MPHDCPTAEELQRLATGAEASMRAREHAAACADCARRIEEIRENERFLASAGGGLARAFDHGPAIEPRLTVPPRGGVPGYELISELSRGGQGVIFRAVQTSTKRPAAVKMLLGGAFASARQRARFEREIEIAASLRHPGIVTVFESGQTGDGQRYVAMELVEGTPLDEYVHDPQQVLSAGGRDHTDGVMRLMRLIASGVAHAHGAGVVHRDLKPSNILVDRAGTPRILDFGLARATEAAGGGQATMEFVGTPAFAAPEQFAGGPPSMSPKADVYALGLIMYQSLTGAMPYPVDGAIAEVARTVMSTDPVPPSKHMPSLSVDIETIVLKCLAKDPDRRYPDAAAVEADIADYLAGRPISARRDSTMYLLSMLARRHRVTVAAGALVLLTVFGAAVGLSLLARDLNLARRNAEAALAASNVQRARLLAAAGDIERGESLLWREAMGSAWDHAPDLSNTPDARRAAWALIELYAQSPRVFRVPVGGVPLSVGFAPDGSVWCNDLSGRRHRWSSRGDRLPTSSAGDATARGLVSSPDGRFVALLAGGTISIRDLELDRTVSGPAPWSDDGEPKALSPDGQLLLSTHGSAKVARLTDARSFRTIGEFEPDVEGAAFLGRGERDALLLSAWCNGEPCLIVREPPGWDVPSITEAPKDLLSGNPSGFRCFEQSASGDVLFAAIHSHVLQFDLGTRPATLLRGLYLSGSPIARLSISAEHNLLAAIRNDGAIRLMRADDLSPVASIENGLSGGGIAISPDGLRVVCGDNDRRLSVYETTPRAWLGRVESTPVTHASIDAAPDGTVAWVDDRGHLFIRGASPPHAISSFAAHSKEATSVAWSPDSSRLITTGFDGAVRKWTRGGALLRTVAEGLEPPVFACFGPDGATVAVGDGAGVVRIWKSGPSEPSMVFETKADRIPQLAFSPDGGLLVCATVGMDCLVLNVATGQEAFRLAGHGRNLRAVAFSPDGRTIVTGGDDRSVRLWDVRTGELLRTIDGLPWGPYELAFHPTGRVLIAAGPGAGVLVLDPEAGTELAKLAIHDRPIFSVAFDAPGKRLYTAGEDSWIGIVDLEQLRSYLHGNRGYWADTPNR